MSEDSAYNDADIVWVKLGNSWWPGEVCGQRRQPEGFLELAKRKPYCVVKFFQEDTFEYVKSAKHILPFNCSKKDEFIKRGHELFKAKKKFMEKFPSDVSTAERLTRSVTRSTLFFNSRPDSIVKAILGQSPGKIDVLQNGGRCDSVTKIINLTPNRSTEVRSASSSPATYKCSLCNFQSTRQNVMVLHRKSHSNTAGSTKNALVNISSNTSPAAVDCLNRPTSHANTLCTSPSPTRLTDHEPRVENRVSLFQSNITKIKADEESERSSIEKGVSQTIKSTKIPAAAKIDDMSEIKKQTNITPFLSPSHALEVASVLVNKGVTCKSTEIQKSLLADWMDEDKDDEDEEQIFFKVKSYTINEALPEAHKNEVNSALTISAPTSPELLKGVDLNYHGETSSSSESSKPSTKIRNIPKKDRRNINFTDFKDDQKTDSGNKNNSEPEASTKDQFCSEHFVNDSRNETVLKKHEELLIRNATGDKMSKSEGNQPLEGILTNIQTIAHNSATEDNPILPKNKAAPQDCTSETQVVLDKIPSESVSESCGFPTNTEAKKTECSVEAFPRSKVYTDSNNSAASLLNRTEATNDLNNMCTTAEITLGNAPNIFKNTSHDLDIFTHAQEHSNQNLENNPALLQKEYTLNQINSKIPKDCSLNKEVGMHMEENIKVQQRISNEFINVEPEKEFTKWMRSSTEQKMILEEKSMEQMKLIDGDSMNYQCSSETFNASQLHHVALSGVTSDITVNWKNSKEVSIKENTTCNEKKSNILAEEEKKENYDDCSGVIPKNNFSPQSQVEKNIKQRVTETMIENEALKEIQKDVEVSESQTVNSIDKTSLSCFDFAEEEDHDVLTSIAKFKKKNIFSEKSNDKKEICCKTQHIERDLKDKQLSLEIESLLRTTEMLVPTNSSTSAEVRGLPIKERGKRIFKSRNRLRAESCSSGLSIASVTKRTESFDVSNKEEGVVKLNSTEAFEQHNVAEIGKESFEAKDQAKSKVFIGNKFDKISFENVNVISNEVTNSEEEIVGRVVFSPAEVYAVSPESNTISENTNNQVTSSRMEIANESQSDRPEIVKENSSEKLQSSEDSLRNMPNENSETFEAKERIRLQQENQTYYEVVEESPLEAIVQFVQPECAVENRIMQGDIVFSQQKTHEQVGENQTLQEDIGEIAQVVNEVELHEDKEDVQQEVQGHLNEFFVVEESETIYEEEVSYEDVSNKVIDSAYENSNDYELITTEVSSIVERIGSEENVVECRDAKSREKEVSNVKSKNVEQAKRRSTECNMSFFSTTDNALVTSQVALLGEVPVFPEAEQLIQSDNPILSEESNTCSTLENISKSSYNEKNIHQEPKSIQCHVERTETSSDENSTIISEAEAEFGSPTSMLEEDRVLKTNRRGSETSATNIEYPKELHTGQVQKTEALTNTNSFCRKGDVILQQSSQTVPGSGALNDAQTSPSNVNDIENESGKENVDNLILKVIQKELLKIKEKEVNMVIEVSSKNRHNLSESNSDTDLGDEDVEEDEEEISSPPIEPLQDENAVETCSDINLSNSTSFEFTHKEIEKSKNDILNSIDNSHQQEKSSSIIYSLIESKRSVRRSKGNKDILTETKPSQTIEQNSKIAGEELSAAEALLSIPNQSGSNLRESTDLSSCNSVAARSPIEGNRSFELELNKVKDEPIDNTNTSCKIKDHASKEFIGRKGRSHLKVTPRKRIIDTDCADTLSLHEVGVKIPKFSHGSEPWTSKTAIKEEDPENKATEEEVNVEATHKVDAELLEKSTPEKVHITVDISNPLSSQIATILGSMDSSESTPKNIPQKRKTTLEDDITSFVIKKPNPTTDAEAEAADRETIAQIQNLCPQVEITRKSSKDEQQSQTSIPLVLNNQILRSGNNQPIITVTPKSRKLEDGFDINNMPIVLSNDNVLNEKVHLVITPTSNPQIIKQFKNQQLLFSTKLDSRSFTSSPLTVSTSRITSRRQSNLRTKRTPTRQQIQEQNCQKEQEQIPDKINEDENDQSPVLQQHSTAQLQVYTQQPLPQQQQTPQLEQHKRQEQLRPHQPIQMHTQHSPAQFQNQFQLHQQQKLQQQLQEESVLMQQQQQMMIQQQLQNQQRPQLQRTQQQHQQQQILIHQQLSPVEKSKSTNISDKQIGVDARGKKYVIIKAPSNTVVMDQSPETIKAGLQNVHQPCTHQPKNAASHRKQRQTVNVNKKPLSHQLQTMSNIKLPSSLSQNSPVSSHTEQTSLDVSNNSELRKNEQQTSQIFTPIIPHLPLIPPKGRGKGRGRGAKQVTTTASTTAVTTFENPAKNVKSNAHGRRTTGSYCESPRLRTTRSATAKKIDSISPLTSEPIPTTAYHSHCSVNTVNTVTTISTPIEHNLLMKGQILPANEEVTVDVSIEKSRVSGGCYAVPALPVPGFPHTFLVCELIDNKYREAYSKLLYLSSDGTRLCEIPDELVTDAHLKLSDDQREPNPDYIQVGSGALQIDKSIRLQMQEQDKLNTGGEMESNQKSNEIFKHDSLSVEEQASALLCLQEQIVQEQLAQEQLVQKQYVPEQLVHGQLVQEQLAQEQLVQEQLVQEQFVQEHFVQDQFGREQFVQEQFVQEQFVPEQFVQEQIAQEQLVRGQFMQHGLKGDQDILHMPHSIENDETHDIIQQLGADTVVMDESVESPNAVVLNIGSQHLVLDHTAFMNMCENNTEGMSPDGNIFTLTQEGLQELLNSYNSTRNETSAMVFTGDGCEQRVMMNENILHTDDISPDGLRIALNDPRLYTDEQFINSGNILQIETPEGLRLISTAPGSSGIVIQSMPSEGKTCDGNIHDESRKSTTTHDDKHCNNNKLKFESETSGSTLDDCLNVIGVSSQTPAVPTSLELSQAEIATKNRGPSPGTIAMNEIVATGLCHHPDITSLPSMGSNEQDMHYGFFSSNTGSHNDKVNVNGESVIADMDEYTVGSSSGNFDDPGR